VLIKIWQGLKHHTRFGLITGFAITLYIGIVKGTSLKDLKVAEFGIFLILIIGIAVSAMRFLKNHKYQVDFGTAFGNAFRTAAMASLLVVAFNMLSYVMYPQLKQQKLEQLRQQGKALGKPDVEVDKVVAEQDKNFYSLELSRTIFPLMLLGAISSLVMSLARPRVNSSTLPKN
jgi:hypothetical protein